MAQFHKHKELEKKINETLYSNILLLSKFYPTRSELKEVLQKGMFLKNNKAAFFEVVYYLLHVINPTVLRQKLTFWPIVDIKEEATFRNEILTYINELNLVYEEANIPLCKMSTLLSPGGMKFAQLMFHISQLAMITHLKRKGDKDLIHPLKPVKEVPKTAPVKHLKRVVDFLQQDNKELLDKFDKEFHKFKSEALALSGAIEDVDAQITAASKLLEETERKFVETHPNYPSDVETEQQITQIKKQVDNLVVVNRILKSGENLVQLIMKNTLVHNKSTFVCPPEVSQVITDKKELDLGEFYKGLAIVLRRINVAFKEPSSMFLEESTAAVAQLKAKYADILRQLQNQENCIAKLADNVKSMH